MKYLQVTNDTKLTDIADIVSSYNVQHVLAANNLERTPMIGKSFLSKCKAIIAESPDVSWQRKSTVLNTLTSDSDVFEKASLQSDEDWKVLSTLGTFYGMLKIPDDLNVPTSYGLLGDETPVDNTIYKNAMKMLADPPHYIDPSIFNEVSTIRPAQILSRYRDNSNFTQFFHLPWGDITLYSSLESSGVDIPAYPEEYEDSRKANYTTMPDMLYQYEPWQLYESSGPRANNFDFQLHRDMWTGDHRDANANNLIRFCQANCYPRYHGSAVNVPIVSLYVKGRCLISGVMTDCSVNWNGPIGLDGWYLAFKLSLSITEISQTALNYDTIRSKSIIG